ncbi:MAG TPA: hypothetical protein PKA00_18415, partial [Saprospiraceae bacterium]|nr:hypothetical protein [Saprospiraceae bacterium]
MAAKLGLLNENVPIQRIVLSKAGYDVTFILFGGLIFELGSVQKITSQFIKVLTLVLSALNNRISNGLFCRHTALLVAHIVPLCSLLT